MAWHKRFTMIVRGAFALQGSEGSDVLEVEIEKGALTTEQALDLAAGLRAWAEEKIRMNSR